MVERGGEGFVDDVLLREDDGRANNGADNQRIPSDAGKP